MTLKRNLLAIAAAATLCTASAMPAEAARRADDVTNHPAYVADPGFVDLARADTKIIEVTIKGALLRSVARIAANFDDEDFNEEFYDFLTNLRAINAVILEDWKGDEDVAEDMIEDVVRDLERGDWERIVRIRSPEENLRVYVHVDRDDKLDGLLVLMNDENQVVFANIVGVIDLEYVAAMSDHVQIPGLDRVPTERPSNGEDGGRS